MTGDDRENYEPYSAYDDPNIPTPGVNMPPPDEFSDFDDDYSDDAPNVEAIPNAGPSAVVGTGTRRRPPAAPPPRRGGPQSRRGGPQPRRQGYGCADVITAIFLLLTVLIVSITVLLIANPQSPFNPFPPPTFPPLRVFATPGPTATPTITLTPEPPTPTVPTATPTPTETPTETPTATITPTPVVAGPGGGANPGDPPVGGPTSANTPASITSSGTRPPFPFSVKSIRYQPNDGPTGCRWQSIAGVVLNLQGVPRTRDEGGLTVHIKGDNGRIDQYSPTGEQTKYGESGFEAFLGETPRVATFTIELLGVTGAPIAEPVFVQTRNTCEENVAVIEFIQNYTY